MMDQLCEFLLEDGELQKYFATELRGNLFNGFLTLGGFLLAAYTFIIIHMKNSVFDSDEYKKNFLNKKKSDQRLRLYAPLARLASRLFYCVVLTLIAGLMQLTLGLIETNLAASLCIFMAIAACVSVAEAMRLMAINMKAWITLIDKSHDDTQ